MLKRIATYLIGYLRIEVRGGRIERFLNLAVSEGMLLWAITRHPDRMLAYIALRDFWDLRPVARDARCRVRILGRHGFPFLLSRLKRRPLLIAGAAACAAFLVWVTGHIWFVQVKVTGPQNLDPRAVEAVAAEAGLRPGAWKADIDVLKLQEHLQKRLGEVSWAGLRIRGTRAIIEVVEKAAHNLPDQAACINLHARRDGVIEEVIPFQGEPVVKKGDIVRRGDLLVECSFKYWAGGRPAVLPGTKLPPRETTARTVVAQALIRARVSHQEYMEVPRYQEVPVPTGQRTTRWVLKWGDRSIIVWGKKECPFSRCQEHRTTYGLDLWRIWKAPVELVKVDADEVHVRRDRISVSDAQERAREQMEARLRWILGPSDKVVRPLEVSVVEQERDFIGIRVTVETLEEIATPVEGAPIPLKPQGRGEENARP